MAYNIPKDLNPVPTVWRPLPLAERIRIVVAEVKAYPLWAKQAAVAVSIIEQPTRVPVHNVGGVMCQGTVCGWGWGVTAWTDAGVMPSGYALIKEGLTGKPAPFLAFASDKDSLQFLCQQVYEDGENHYDGEAYCLHWYGIAPDNAMWDSSRHLFDTILDKTVKSWPSAEQVPGYRDAGASA